MDIVFSDNEANSSAARAILGVYNAFALLVFAHGVRRSFGVVVATWYLAFQVSQFHLIYYASRPLSNMFAFGLTTLAMRYLLPDSMIPVGRPGDSRLSLVLLTMAGVIFRSELAVLVAMQTLFLLFTRQASFFRDAVYAGILGLVVGLSATVITDSLFWDRFLWPELDAFLFNVVSGQSSEWGTDPWYFYFLNALPRLLLNPLTYLIALPVALRQPATRQPAVPLLVPSLAFVFLYSIIPHKEWRFIIYVIPSLTTAASLGAGYLWTHRSRSLFSRIASHLLVLSTLASFLLSNLVLLPASAANYPGAHALNALHRYHNKAAGDDSQPHGASVYLGNLACQTGVTRFLQQPASLGWLYDKTEDEATKSLNAFWDKFDYIIVEASADPEYRDSDETQLRSALPESQWETADTVDGFAGISILRPGSLADGAAERKLLSIAGGQRAVDLYEQVRDSVRKVLLRGWWVELKMKPKLKVLKRVRRD
jgi:alpha-1,6-mannosyltransferase